MDVIGPSFYSELVAAGVQDFRFVWDTAGNINYHEDVSQAQRDIVATVLAAHDPTTPAPPSSRELQRQAAVSAIDTIQTDPNVPQGAKDALAAVADYLRGLS